MLIFLALTAWIVYRGVEKGIEKFSSFIMPGLIVLIVVIAVFSLTLSHTDADDTVRTGMQGLMVYLKPDFTGLTVKRFLEILLDAMSQLFFSLSVSMGIMVTYGSYVKDDVNLSKAMNQIELFDTGVAVLAGMMIIPAVFVFLGTDGVLRTEPDLYLFAEGLSGNGWCRTDCGGCPSRCSASRSPRIRHGELGCNLQGSCSIKLAKEERAG